jgi:hypothetical protein
MSRLLLLILKQLKMYVFQVKQCQIQAVARVNIKNYTIIQ